MHTESSQPIKHAAPPSASKPSHSTESELLQFNTEAQGKMKKGHPVRVIESRKSVDLGKPLHFENDKKKLTPGLIIGEGGEDSRKHLHQSEYREREDALSQAEIELDEDAAPQNMELSKVETVKLLLKMIWKSNVVKAVVFGTITLIAGSVLLSAVVATPFTFGISGAIAAIVISVALIGIGAGALAISPLLAEEYQEREFSPEIEEVQRYLEEHVMQDMTNLDNEEISFEHFYNKYSTYLKSPFLLPQTLKIFEELISKQAALNNKKKNLKKAYEDREALSQKIAAERKLFAELKKNSEEKEIKSNEKSDLKVQLELKRKEIESLQGRLENLSKSIADFEAKTDLEVEADTINREYIALLNQLKSQRS